VPAAANFRSRRLTVVASGGGFSQRGRPSGAGAPEQSLRDLDWAILMSRGQAGDKQAYHRLLEEITSYLRFLASKAFQSSGDVEDIVQEVLLTVHTIRHTYDPGRPFGPWLAAIANRRIVDGLRRQGRTRSRETPLDDEHDEIPERESSSEATSADGPVLRRAVDALPPAQREAIRLLKLEEMSLKQASAASGMSIASLKVSTHRALKALRKALKGEQ
jgi:RNA polymerase sigma factor (sigma-70 family)